MKTLTALVVSLGFTALVSAQTLSNYQFTVTSQSPSAYFKLDGDFTDSITPSQVFSPSASGSFFSADAVRHPGTAYAFLNQGDALTLPTDIIPGGDTVTNAAAAGKGSLTLLFRSLDGVATGQRFIFAQGAATTASGNALSLFFENNTTTNGGQGDLKLRVGNATTSILSSNDVAYDQWYFFGMTWDESRDAGEVVWYLGRSGQTLLTGTIDISNDAVVGDNGTVALGNQPDFSSGYRNPGEGRVDEFAVWTRELSPPELASQFSNLPNYFPASATYQNLIAAQYPAHYLKLDGSFADAMDPTTGVGTNGLTGAFTTNVLGVADSAYSFTSADDALIVTNDIVSGGGLAANGSAHGVGTISFLFRMLSDINNTGQRFIFSQGTNNGAATRDALNLFLENTNSSNGDPNALKLRLGNTTTTLLQPTSFITNAWYYFAIAYDESRDSQSGGEVRWFVGPVGGTLAAGAFNPANDAIVGDNGYVFLGNRTNLTSGFRLPGSGALDEFATWSDELSPAEIAAQFAAIGSQASVPAPSLQISVAGSDVILSWPSSTSPSYQLEATASLIAPTAWTNAGSPTTVGSLFVVTNALAPSGQFFRLHKP